MKDKSRAAIIGDTTMRTAMKRDNSSMLNLPNVPSLSRYDSSRVDVRESRLDDSCFERSPITSISRKEDE